MSNITKVSATAKADESKRTEISVSSAAIFQTAGITSTFLSMSLHNTLHKPVLEEVNAVEIFATNKW
jgi:hypothetical protein